MINKTRGSDLQPFSGLTPEVVLDAAAAFGLAPDGRLFALNSYENRVYQLGAGEGELVPDALRERYVTVSGALLERVSEAFTAAAGVREIRLHGDCHLGNLLWNEHGPVFVDLDDCASGVRAQDLWMMLAGSPAEQQRQWGELLEGYRQFADFDFAEVRLIEPLRALRMLHHAAWVAHRWRDPAFPRAFPWAAEPRYWEGYLQDLLEQIAVIDEPPLLRQ